MMGLSGSRRGVLNVLRSVIALKEGFYIFKCYRGKIVAFDAGIKIPFIHLSVSDNLMTMEVAMHVAQIMPLKTRWMDGDVSED